MSSAVLVALASSHANASAALDEGRDAVSSTTPLDAVARSAVQTAQALLALEGPHPSRRRRGLAGQRGRREVEQQARRDAVDARARLNEIGMSLGDISSVLRTPARTIRDWAQRHAEGGLAPVALGRRPKRGTPEQRNAVVAVLGDLGPFAAISTLRQVAPGLARRELHELRWRHRRYMREAGHATAQVLSWHRPGAVWAMDYTEVPWRIDDHEKYVLSVRDLASGNHLLALVAEHADAKTTRAALALLFAEHGAPLVVKSDNGSHFVEAGVRALLDEHRVLHLRSPKGTPAYNGACESGIHWLKARALQFAVREGRDRVSAGDIDAARALGNDVARRLLGTEQSATQVWARRLPISPEERDGLHLVVAPLELEARSARGLHAEHLLTDDQRAEVAREAIGRALHERGFVSTRRRSIPLPKKR